MYAVRDDVENAPSQENPHLRPRYANAPLKGGEKDAVRLSENHSSYRAGVAAPSGRAKAVRSRQRNEYNTLREARALRNGLASSCIRLQKAGM